MQIVPYYSTGFLVSRARIMMFIGTIISLLMLMNTQSLYAQSTANPPPVQIFYIPIPEDQAANTFEAINSGQGGNQNTYISIAAVANGTIVYYDQWENGYEGDIANPLNLYSGSNTGGTQIWGDGIASNGCVPNKNGVAIACTNANDLINAGNVIVLDSNIEPTPAGMAIIDFDARDKIGTSKPIAMTRTGWPDTPGTVFAGATEILDTINWGIRYDVPVGQNTASNNVFSYVAASIMAAQNGTVVTIDPDGTGPAGTTTCTLNEGESCVVGALTKAQQSSQLHPCKLT